MKHRSTTDLWEEHRSRLYNYIARRVPDHHVAEDLLQEVFLKAHLNLERVRAPGSVAAWLFRVAANAIVDYYRTRRPAEKLPEEFAARGEERDSIAELASCLRPFIDDLPEIYRIPLVLSEIEGVTQREVASRLGISVSGAKSRIQRGREKLRRSISRCCAIEIGQNGIIDYEVRNGKCGCDHEEKRCNT